jgi:polysaccharide export outer membrane protein
MRTEFRPLQARAARRFGKVTAFLSAMFVGLVLFVVLPLSSYAQSADSNSNPLLLLQQLQQSGMGQTIGGSSGGLGGLGSLGGFSGQNGQNGQSTTFPAATQQNVVLPISRLEQIMSQRAGARLRQFGYQQLGVGREVSMPQTGAVQDDYVLGPGDIINYTLRGQESGDFSATVGRNGQLILPRFPPMSAMGRTFGAVRADIEAAVHHGYVATEAFVTLSQVRQVNVLVGGEVNVPGVRLLSGLSSVVDAISVSGGIKKTGSLRNVRVQRGGREFTVDLYSVLTDHAVSSNLRLADGDHILVPPLGKTVAITGLVRRPGIYELAPGQSSIAVHTLMTLAGGPEVRGNYRLSALRIAPTGQLQLAPLVGEQGSLQDSEILFAQLGADQTTSQATLSGGVGLAGQYAVSGSAKLSDMLKAPGALGSTPYTLFGLIVRKDTRTLLRNLVAFTPVAVLNGGEDQTLRSDDIVRPISVDEARILNRAICVYGVRRASEQATQRNPLRQDANPVTAPASSSSTSTSAGAASANAPDPNQLPAECDPSGAGGQMVSVTTTSKDPSTFGQQTTTQQVQYPPVDQFGDPILSTAAAQAVTAQQSAAPANGSGNGIGNGNGNNANGTANGNSGVETYVDMDPAPNFQSQSLQPGAIPTNREVSRFSDLALQLGIDPVVLVNFLTDHRVQLEGAVRAPGHYLVGPNVELGDLVQAAGGTDNWTDESGIELISTAVDVQAGISHTRRTTLPLRQGTLSNYIVKPGDQFHFNTTFTDVVAGNVTVQGEVRFPGPYSIVRGEHLSDLLVRSGGLTSTAYPYGTIFLRQSAAETEHQGYLRIADEIDNQLLTGISKTGPDQISGAAFTALQSFSQQLRAQKALGRISIIADPSILASKPELDPLLEPGDMVYIPQRPSTVAVLGQVQQQGSYPYQSGKTVKDYIDEAGGYGLTADTDNTFVVLPDGTARKLDSSWFSFGSNIQNLPPGSAVVVPRDIAPFDWQATITQVTSILSQISVTVASLAVLSTVK